MLENDSLYATPRSRINDFAFDRATATVFKDMLYRSIPGYQKLQEKIIDLAENLPTNGLCYDLGCSIGESSFNIARVFEKNSKWIDIVAVDNSKAMIEYCHSLEQNFLDNINLKFIEADVVNYAIKNADIVLLNYTLQFIKPCHKQTVIEAIYNGLKPKGILLFSEKIEFANQIENQAKIDAYHNFKRKQGYSELEIEQKRVALSNILTLDTLQQHVDRLEKVGFVVHEPWFEQFNFMSMIVQKT